MLIRLRQECSRLFICNTIYDSHSLLDIYSEFLFLAIKNHHEDPVYEEADADAKIIIQMMLTKVLYLKNAINGVSYLSNNGEGLPKLIDPTIIASLIRNIYETVGMFNLIYKSSNSKDEKKILYLLWVHAGLQYRQRFISGTKTKGNLDKFENEKKLIEEVITDIENITLYKNLDEKNQNKIKTKLKEKDYLLKFNKTDVEFLHWHELAKEMGADETLWNNIYTYFSLYSHPSNVSVFQFRDMFKKGEEAFIRLTNFNLQNAFFLFSFFIADYIKLFPKTINTFNNMAIRDQIVIDFFNFTMRGHESSINNSYKILE